MNFPKFWAQGSSRGFSCWRWSNATLAEAEALARDAARKLAEQFAAHGRPQDRYAYADRPLREPVLREFKNPSGELAAVITRNSYGCLVLNAASALFVDIDLPAPKSTAGGWLKKIFGKTEPPGPVDPADRALARAEEWTRSNPGWGWRVYRTKAGLRLLATHALFAPDAAQTLAAFDALGADPLYRQLCKTQKCFRARLTPKPWRCGVAKPPGRWPWPDVNAESRFKEWEARYLEACADYAACALVGTIGHNQTHPDHQAILKVHDEITQAESKLELA